jgi:hypothetical protein
MNYKEKSAISADWYKLMEDAAGTAKYHLSCAIESIDNKLGEGYAKKHPELIGAFISAAAVIEQGSGLIKSILELRNSVDEHASTIWSSVEHIAERM